MIKNLLPVYHEKIYYFSTSNFEDLFHIGVEEEDKMNDRATRLNPFNWSTHTERSLHYDKVSTRIQVARRSSKLSEPMAATLLD